MYPLIGLVVSIVLFLSSPLTRSSRAFLRGSGWLKRQLRAVDRRVRGTIHGRGSTATLLTLLMLNLLLSIHAGLSGTLPALGKRIASDVEALGQVIHDQRAALELILSDGTLVWALSLVLLLTALWRTLASWAGNARAWSSGLEQLRVPVDILAPPTQLAILSGVLAGASRPSAFKEYRPFADMADPPGDLADVWCRLLVFTGPGKAHYRASTDAADRQAANISEVTRIEVLRNEMEQADGVGTSELLEPSRLDEAFGAGTPWYLSLLRLFLAIVLAFLAVSAIELRFQML